MKKQFSIQTIIIFVLSIAIISMAIGFIVINNKLKTEEKVKEKYEVKINKVIKNNVINGSKKIVNTEYNIIDSNKTVELSMNFKDKNDSISYTVIIKNTGTLPAKIDNVIERTNFDTRLLSIKYNDIIGDVIEPKDEIELNVDINVPNKKIFSKDLIYKLTILTSNIK